MRAAHLLCIGAATIALSACNRANASEFDPSNPLHCAAQFESYSIVAKQQGNDAKSKGFGARAQWYADRARTMPADQITPEALNKLGDRIAAAPDGGIALATECMKRQNDDPDFQRLTRGG